MKIVTFILLFFPVALFAQENPKKDSVPKNKEWKFAAGVTLYSNFPITQKEKPIEFNFRYKLKSNHTLKVNIPIAANKYPHDSYNQNYVKDLSFSEFVELKKREGYTPLYGFVDDIKYSLYGITLGYDYEYALPFDFSIYAGLDLTHYTYKVNFDQYRIEYNFETPVKEKVPFLEIEKNQRQDILQYCSLKPIAGIRYIFRKFILIEASAGYKFDYLYSSEYKNDSLKWTNKDNEYTASFDKFKNSEKVWYKDVTYNISLLYIF